MHDKQENKFDSQLQTYYEQIKQKIREEHTRYVKNHPQLRQILNDFLSSLLLEQPGNVYDYARQYFHYFNIDKDRLTFKPLVVSGHEAGGKSLLAKQLVKAHPELFELSIRFTTKQPNQGQVHGKDFYFVSHQQFLKEISKGAFAQYCQINDHYYGNHKGKIKDIVYRGKICLIDIDYTGALKILESIPDANLIFLESALSELQSRLKAAHKPEDKIKRALDLARKEAQEVKSVSKFHRVMSTTVPQTLASLKNVLKPLYPSVKL